eukprot:gene12898-15151_t
MTHAKHPIVLWTATSDLAYRFVCDHGLALSQEYTRRYKKVHLCHQHLMWLSKNTPSGIKSIPSLGQMPQCMPVEYQVRNGTGSMEDTVNAYRAYYIGEKLSFCTYKDTEWPDWLPPAPPKQSKSKKTKKFSSNDPNGPIQAPIFGALLSLTTLPHHKLKEYSERYGKTFRLYFGDHYTIVTSDPTVIKSIWSKHFDLFSNRPHTPTFQLLSGNYKNLSLSDYPIWRRNRDNLAHAFSKTKLKQNAADVITKNTSYLINRMKEFEATKQPFYPEIYLKKYSFNIILNMGFSVEIPYDEAVGEGILGELVEPIEGVILQASAGNIFDYFNALGPLYLAYKNRTYTPVESIINVVRRIRQEHLNSIDRENPRDIMDQLIIAYPDEQDTQSVLQMGLDMMVAGSDTSAGTLNWFIQLMVNNPESQEKVYSELESVVGKGMTVTTQHRNQTPYLNACIKEVMRKVPIAPLGLPRVAQESMMIGDIFVPKGTQVMHNLYALHHDKSYWVEPERFVPERFLTNNHTDYFIPFSVGPRNCVGLNLANDELYVAIGNMLMNFKFTSSTGKPIDETERFGLTISPAVKYSVMLESRS